MYMAIPAALSLKLRVEQRERSWAQMTVRPTLFPFKRVTPYLMPLFATLAVTSPNT